MKKVFCLIVLIIFSSCSGPTIKSGTYAITKIEDRGYSNGVYVVKRYLLTVGNIKVSTNKIHTIGDSITISE